jgi:hypothetical protein
MASERQIIRRDRRKSSIHAPGFAVPVPVSITDTDLDVSFSIYAFGPADALGREAEVEQCDDGGEKFGAEFHWTSPRVEVEGWVEDRWDNLIKRGFLL